jgi:hypothetical protein
MTLTFLDPLRRTSILVSRPRAVSLSSPSSSEKLYRTLCDLERSSRWFTTCVCILFVVCFSPFPSDRLPPVLVGSCKISAHPLYSLLRVDLVSSSRSPPSVLHILYMWGILLFCWRCTTILGLPVPMTRSRLPTNPWGWGWCPCPGFGCGAAAAAPLITLKHSETQNVDLGNKVRGNHYLRHVDHRSTHIAINRTGPLKYMSD